MNESTLETRLKKIWSNSSMYFHYFEGDWGPIVRVGTSLEAVRDYDEKVGDSIWQVGSGTVQGYSVGSCGLEAAQPLDRVDALALAETILLVMDGVVPSHARAGERMSSVRVEGIKV